MAESQAAAYLGLAVSLFVGLASWLSLKGGGMKMLADAVAVSASLKDARPEDRPFLEARFYRLMRRTHFRGKALAYLVAVSAASALATLGLQMLSLVALPGKVAGLAGFFALVLVAGVLAYLSRRYVSSGESTAVSLAAQREREALDALAKAVPLTPVERPGVEERLAASMRKNVLKQQAWMARHPVLAKVAVAAYALLVLAWVAVMAWAAMP